MNIKEILAAKAAKKAQDEQAVSKEAVSFENTSPVPVADFSLDKLSLEVFDAAGNSLGLFLYGEAKTEFQKAERLSKINKKFVERAASFATALALAEEQAANFEEDNGLTPQQDAEQATLPSQPTVIAEAVAETFSLSIELNERQQAAEEMALAGKSFVLIGAAGTGKTSCQRSIAKALWQQGYLKDINFSSKKDEPRIGLSFAACAFTRRASANLRRAIHKDPELAKVFDCNIVTIHALLEYEPVYYTDAVTGKDTMRFLPRRNSTNKLEITHLVVEEASMVGAYDLWAALYEALPEGVQIIFIGDINQLPPVFGPSILNYALIQLPVIELTHVYRQQGDSGILENAHRILRGEPVQSAKDVFIIQGRQPQHVSQERTSMALYKMFQMWHDSGEYDPEQDIILSPYNEQAMGTIHMNSLIAQFLGDKREALVYEVIAGFNKHYLAVGDTVMFDKQDAEIVRIVPNMRYMGKAPQPAGRDLSRFGTRTGKGSDKSIEDLEGEPGYANFNLETLMEEQAERKLSASHLVDIKVKDTGFIRTLEAAGDFSPQVFQLGYVLTGHKSQGCEWRHVFVLYHPGHRTMIFREWLYTVWTRASKGLYVLSKQWLLDRAVANPRIKGNTLEEKITFFNSGLGQLQAGVYCTKS